LRRPPASTRWSARCCPTEHASPPNRRVTQAGSLPRRPPGQGRCLRHRRGVRHRRPALPPRIVNDDPDVPAPGPTELAAHRHPPATPPPPRPPRPPPPHPP